VGPTQPSVQESADYFSVVLRLIPTFRRKVMHTFQSKNHAQKCSALKIQAVGVSDTMILDHKKNLNLLLFCKI
jgi:hypothetical protein